MPLFWASLVSGQYISDYADLLGISSLVEYCDRIYYVNESRSLSGCERASRASSKDLDTADRQWKTGQLETECGRVQRNAGIMDSHLSGPKLSMHHDDDYYIRTLGSTYFTLDKFI